MKTATTPSHSLLVRPRRLPPDPLATPTRVTEPTMTAAHWWASCSCSRSASSATNSPRHSSVVAESHTGGEFGTAPGQASDLPLTPSATATPQPSSSDVSRRATCPQPGAPAHQGSHRIAEDNPTGTVRPAGSTLNERTLDARQLGMVSALHLDTVRFQLQILGEAGLVHCEPDSSGSRGRPRLQYTPITIGGAPPGYQLLAAALAAHCADSPAEPYQRAERAGRAAAAEQAFAPGRATSATRAITADHAAARIGGLFAELGFELEVAREGNDLQLRLHACPFRAVATDHPEAVWLPASGPAPRRPGRARGAGHDEPSDTVRHVTPVRRAHHPHR